MHNSASVTEDSSQMYLETNNNQERKFHCQWNGCNKAFMRKTDVTRHYRIHLNDRPFKCIWPGCGKAFMQRSATSSLARHRRTHQFDTPFPCSFRPCQEHFATRKLLAEHEKVVHNAVPVRRQEIKGSAPENYDLPTPQQTPGNSPPKNFVKAYSSSAPDMTFRTFQKLQPQELTGSRDMYSFLPSDPTEAEFMKNPAINRGSNEFGTSRNDYPPTEFMPSRSSNEFIPGNRPTVKSEYPMGPSVGSDYQPVNDYNQKGMQFIPNHGPKDYQSQTVNNDYPSVVNPDFTDPQLLQFNHVQTQFQNMLPVEMNDRRLKSMGIPFQKNQLPDHMNLLQLRRASEQLDSLAAMTSNQQPLPVNMTMMRPNFQLNDTNRVGTPQLSDNGGNMYPINQQRLDNMYQSQNSFYPDRNPMDGYRRSSNDNNRFQQG